MFSKLIFSLNYIYCVYIFVYICSIGAERKIIFQNLKSERKLVILKRNSTFLFESYFKPAVCCCKLQTSARTNITGK